MGAQDFQRFVPGGNTPLAAGILKAVLGAVAQLNAAGTGPDKKVGSGFAAQPEHGAGQMADFMLGVAAAANGKPVVQGVDQGLPEEDLRYLKPQATEFKAIIGMNAHALHDWFSIRCCRNAQHEIRHLARTMLKLCREAAPDLFAGAGPSCVQLGYCPENRLQNPRCKGRIPTKDEALEILRAHGRGMTEDPTDEE